MKKLITTGAAAAVALTGLGLAPAMAEDSATTPFAAAETCPKDGGWVKVETPTTNPVTLMFDHDGDPQTNEIVVGSAEYDVPSAGFVTVDMEPGYEAQFCVKGGSSNTSAGSIVDSDWVTDGVVGGVVNANGPAGVSHFSYMIRRAEIADSPVPPTVTKTVTPSYTRDYVWTIDKTVDDADVLTSGKEHTATYWVVVDKSEPNDSDFSLTGEITVTNPNSAPITVTGITDNPGLDGVECTVEPIAEDGVIPAGKSATVSYDCDLGGTLDDSEIVGLNTAIVDWTFDNEAKAPVTGDASWDFARANVTTTNDTATVTDLFANQDLDVLVTQEGETVLSDDYTFEYDRTMVVPDADCLPYDNTATVIGNGGFTASDDASVQVCRETNSGGHTIGYWQNKNGQGFVKSEWEPVRSAIDTYYQSEKHIGSLPADDEAAKGADWVKTIVTADVTRDRVAMFDKQYLATVLSTVFAETKDIDLAGTTIKVSAELRVILGLDDQLVTVGDLLTATKTHYSAITEDDEQREALKDIFDALNNNEQPIFDDAVTA